MTSDSTSEFIRVTQDGRPAVAVAISLGFPAHAGTRRGLAIAARRGFGRGKSEGDFRPRGARLNLHLTPEVTHPLTHAANSHAGALQLNLGEFFGWNSLAPVLDREEDTFGIASDA